MCTKLCMQVYYADELTGSPKLKCAQELPSINTVLGGYVFVFTYAPHFPRILALQQTYSREGFERALIVKICSKV